MVSQARAHGGDLVKRAAWQLDPAEIGGPAPDDAEAVAAAREARSAYAALARPIARPLRAFAPEAARADLDNGAPGLLGALRDVVTVFVDVAGLEPALLQGDVAPVQAAMEAATRSFRAYQGMLRQFAVDDKGVVFIGAFGAPRPVGRADDRTSRGTDARGPTPRELERRRRFSPAERRTPFVGTRTRTTSIERSPPRIGVWRRWRARGSRRARASRRGRRSAASSATRRAWSTRSSASP